FFKQTAHDFTAAGLGQTLGKTDLIRTGNSSDLLDDMRFQFFFQFRGSFLTLLEGDKNHHRLAFDFIRFSDRSGFSHFRMTDQRAFHFGRAQAMARYVQNVIDTARDPEITLLVLTGSVSGEVTSFDVTPILNAVTRGIAIDRAQHRRPGTADDQL